VRRTDPNGTVTDYLIDGYGQGLADVQAGTPVGSELLRVPLGDQWVASQWEGAGLASFLYPDDLHSTESSQTGSSDASVEYSPYGLYRTSSGTLPTDRQFQGQQNQASVGLYHMGARWYDPTIGLWTQPDTIVPNPMDPLSLNRYAFVEGNPLTNRDPTGHSSETGCQDPTNCINNNTGSGSPETGSSNTQQLSNGQTPCDLLPLACKPIGNYAVWVYACDDGDCAWYYLPLPGAVPPPDASGGGGSPSEDLGGDQGLSGQTWDARNRAQNSGGLQSEIPGFENVPTKPPSGATEGHHVIPREILARLPEAVRKLVQGKKGSPNIWDIPVEVHDVIHQGPRGGAYNAEWRKALNVDQRADLSGLASQDIFGIRDRIVRMFGLGQYQP
jgi:RHS repeat-associated protein